MINLSTRFSLHGGTLLMADLGVGSCRAPTSMLAFDVALRRFYRFCRIHETSTKNQDEDKANLETQ